MRPAAAGKDTTPVWVFDRLLGLEVPASVLVEHILPAVAASADDLPDATAAKLRLRLLDEDTDLGRVDETTLSYLQQLESCRVGPLADEARVCPPHGLLLKVKTELCIQTFRDRPLNVGEAEVVLNTVFQGDNTVEDYARYERLRAALRSPEVAQALVAEFPFQRLLVELAKYVERARTALPCFLLALQEDLDSGRMIMQGDGRPLAPAAAAPSPAARAAPAASPHRGWPQAQPSPTRQQPAAVGQHGLARYGAGAALEEEVEDVLPPVDDYVSPPPPLPQQQPRSAGRGFGQREQPAVLDQLNAELHNLGQQGGDDPLPEMLGRAAAAQAAGGGAGAAAAAAAAGRNIKWDSPAVEHPMPEMTPPGRRQQHPPLVQPVAGRRRSGRAGAAAEADDGDGDEGQRRQERGGNQRRKPVRWSPEEEGELVRLVKIHGRGSWAIIQEQGQAKFEGRRSQIDLKDKWRNLVKHDRIEPHHLEEIEAREAEIRTELDAQAKRPPGRPPRFASPVAKRRRRGAAASSDGEEEEEEEEEEDPVEDADGDEEADDNEAAEDEDADDDEAAAAAAEEEEEEEPQPQPERRRLRSRRG